MISNSCKNSNQYTVVDSFVDIGLSMWFVLAILYLTLANNAMYNELLMHVKRWLTNRLHGKAAELELANS